ncbi:hypothetical protein CRG98_007270 [Punica granatum]|uniref:BHLH domain-containing protein n=1 Tax=Punica granatum TaxID=22663 RepID=A0A2I0KVP0_PUNGR|nr:hypothetical protein CRG98_007270 [Punica granatum]
MRNSFLPPLSPQALSFGNNEFRMPSMDISSIVDNKMSRNGHSDSLWSLPRLFNDEEMKGANFGINYFQPIVISPPTGYRNISCDGVIGFEQQQGQSKKHFLGTPQTAHINERKCPLEAKEHKSATAEENKAPSEWKNNKRKRSSCSSRQFHPQAKRISMDLRENTETVRRSQKIGDKITALQKLVSPYGKTDTASVLQEASLYIKLLQGQIQHLFQMLSSSYSSISPLQLQENGKKQIDLRSRGLCLVPVSSIQGVTKETKVDNHSIHHYSH